MQKFNMCVENEEDAFFQNGQLIITEKDEALKLIEKLQKFYNNNDNEYIKKHNNKIIEQWENEIENNSKTEAEKIKENSEFVMRYDSTMFEDSLESIELLYEKEKIFESKVIDMREIKYPLIVSFYNNGELVEIGYTASKLDRYLSSRRNDVDFDTYSILEVEESYLVGIYTHLRLVYLGIPNKGIPVENGVYVTLNQIKKRYKYKNRIKPSIIKQIIENYDVTRFDCGDGTILIHKKHFEDAKENSISFY